MPEVIRTSRDATDAPQHEVRDTLRPVVLPTGTLRVGGPGSIAHAAAQTRHLRVPGDRNQTGYDFDANGQLVTKGGQR